MTRWTTGRTAGGPQFPQEPGFAGVRHLGTRQPGRVDTLVTQKNGDDDDDNDDGDDGNDDEWG